MKRIQAPLGVVFLIYLEFGLIVSNVILRMHYVVFDRFEFGKGSLGFPFTMVTVYVHRQTHRIESSYVTNSFLLWGVKDYTFEFMTMGVVGNSIIFIAVLVLMIVVCRRSGIGFKGQTRIFK